nr:hypothetical protein gadd7.2 - long-tailed hamster [Cricetulus longicaudatus]
MPVSEMPAPCTVTRAPGNAWPVTQVRIGCYDRPEKTR